MQAVTLPETAIIIAARNAQDTIRRAVASALAQPEAASIILVDDGSTDATVALAQACPDPDRRLAIIRLPRSLGPAAARNAALEHVSTPYVCVLDADDALQPGRIARLLHIAAEGWDMVADDVLIETPSATHPLLSITGQHPFDLRAFVRGNISHPSRPRQELGFLKPLIRTACLTGHAVRYRPELRLGEDYALYAELLARRARACLVSACGYVATVRPDGLSSRHTGADLRALAEADLDLLQIPGLSPAERRALHRHRRSVTLKYQHRAMLDAKASGHLRAACAALLSTPAATTYILRETLRARLHPARAA